MPFRVGESSFILSRLKPVIGDYHVGLKSSVGLLAKGITAQLPYTTPLTHIRSLYIVFNWYWDGDGFGIRLENGRAVRRKDCRLMLS